MDFDERLERLRLVLQIFYELVGEKRTPPEWPENAIYQSALIAEQAGKLASASLKYYHKEGPRGDIKKEAVELAAIAIRLVLNFNDLEKKYYGYNNN